MSAFVAHGGRLSAACARYGGAPEDWLDLSTGINPVPWPGAQTYVPDWRALPDPAALARLEAVAASHFGADPALCAAVPGSEAGLRALGEVLREFPLAPGPLTYSTYTKAFGSADNGAPGPTVRVLTNPNNPDGTLQTRTEVLAALDRQEADGGWLVVDEAFADPHRDVSVAGEVREGRRLIVTRSFGKFFGLAGLRLGFVLGPLAILDALRRLHGDWPLSSAAIDLGLTAYADTDWIGQARQSLQRRAQALDMLLARHGLAAQGASPLFRLVRTNRAASLFETLARAHILTRPFEGYPQLLRFGLPGHDSALARLEAALTRWSCDG
ncbi:aminotransferase class I/II-fold pyridoxal phosphate-dependent enzyme [Novosphingobium mangrovi (ex Hu et al. 2023)]|uniref:Aminotransferase n=1 Tax=Novosphingobium mangrovi (ex Hu et al. 2023) TaxID=2930094 RepID=A0ABT0ABU7_9SPHN|nr:aminotransferase class I/II-fold pyridoxal phosphate-dependent enzyme [Novosphingobium mangrovi (ex Hu et al. 2023)]MCJ1960683.1 aminotransferase class I/II-fold pyridoxal phosphate-dependent enzyme [Novosphingobium mangrovi (ex Hu et al. 2023)]